LPAIQRTRWLEKLFSAGKEEALHFLPALGVRPKMITPRINNRKKSRLTATIQSCRVIYAGEAPRAALALIAAF
jgi:hypothetical protein